MILAVCLVIAGTLSADTGKRTQISAQVVKDADSGTPTLALVLSGVPPAMSEAGVLVVFRDRDGEPVMQRTYQLPRPKNAESEWQFAFPLDEDVATKTVVLEPRPQYARFASADGKRARLLDLANGRDANPTQIGGGCLGFCADFGYFCYHYCAWIKEYHCGPDGQGGCEGYCECCALPECPP
jgi:hypothetical protein